MSEISDLVRFQFTFLEFYKIIVKMDYLNVLADRKRKVDISKIMKKIFLLILQRFSLIKWEALHLQLAVVVNLNYHKI